MLLPVAPPRAINDIGVNVIRLRSAESWHSRYLRGSSERHHALLPMRTAEHDGIPLPVRLGWHVAKIRHTSVQYPAPGAVEFRRVAIRAAVGIGEYLAAFDLLGRVCLLGRARHLGNLDLRQWEWLLAAELEGEQPRRTVFGVRRHHHGRGRPQAESAAPANRYDHILVALKFEAHGDRLEGGSGLRRPQLLACVRRVCGELNGSLTVKHEIARRRQYAAVDDERMLDTPARRLFFRIPG